MLLYEAKEAGLDVNSATHDAVIDVLGQVRPMPMPIPLRLAGMEHHLVYFISAASEVRMRQLNGEKAPMYISPRQYFTAIYDELYI